MEDHRKYVDYNNVCRCCLIPAENMHEIPPEIMCEITSTFKEEVKILFKILN